MDVAERGYRDILGMAPGNPDALHLLGVVLHQRGNSVAAEANIRQAIETEKGNSAYHRSLGKVLLAEGRYEEAVTCFGNTVRLNPKAADAYDEMGTAYRQMSRIAESVSCYRRALEIDDRYVPAHNNLGLALKDCGEINGAIDCFRRAAEIDPNGVEVYINLGLALQQRGDREAAVSTFRRVIRLAPEQRLAWIHFAEALRYAQIDAADAEFEDDVIACLAMNGVDPQRLAVASLSLLRLNSEFAALLTAVHDVDEVRGLSLTLETVSALNNRLLITLLWNALIPDVDVEILLTQARRALLITAVRGDLSDECEQILFALSAYCYTNEYAFAVTDLEADMAEGLIGRLADEPTEFDQDIRRLVALVGCYRPLHTILGASFLDPDGEEEKDDAFARLIRRQIEEPRNEAKLEAAIESLRPIEDSVSRKVRQFYEENPYPSWRSVAAIRSRPLVGVVRELFPHVTGLPVSEPRRTDILIAGCGTGHSSVQASFRFSEPEILAVDLSRKSLAYAKRRAQELGVQRLKFLHGDILHLGDLGRDFDFIEATGVLMTMDDPLAGWRVLCGLLRPGGFMKIGLYSKIARRNVIAAQEFVAAGNYASTPDGIRQCRQDILRLPQDSDVKGVTRSLDFYAVSPCRDFIFHIQEYCHSLLEIEEMLEELALRFIGFELRDPSVYRIYRKRFPKDKTLSNLKNWHELEVAYPDTFAGMYQFWVRATD